mmetsp:Transcript_23244/g.73762  ORF Transcript_23244/g.73762 Transcript_23244/m.73762 type:complete len:254 (-) Transcript_23244:61-822(-)
MSSSVDGTDLSCSSAPPGVTRSALAPSSANTVPYPAASYSLRAGAFASSTCSMIAGSSQSSAASSHRAHSRRPRPLPRAAGATARLARRARHLYSGKSASVSSAALILRYVPRSRAPIELSSSVNSFSDCARERTRPRVGSTSAISTPTHPAMAPLLGSSATKNDERSLRAPTVSPYRAIMSSRCSAASLSRSRSVSAPPVSVVVLAAQKPSTKKRAARSSEASSPRTGVISKAEAAATGWGSRVLRTPSMLR